MTISEACGLWIEQRVQEELEAKGETGISYREIGRIISDEVFKHFETRVSPETMKSKVIRQAGSNEPPNLTTQNDLKIETKTGEIEEKQVIRDDEGRFVKGTPQAPGPGRPAKAITKEDSDTLFQLKCYWKKAKKGDKKAFLEWIKINNFKGGKIHERTN